MLIHTSRPPLHVAQFAAALMLLHARVTLGQPPAPPPAAPAAAPNTTWQVRDWTRVESWHYFEPKPGGGDPDYTDVANRLFVGVEHRTSAIDLAGALQYVQFGNLPTNATGPGALGSGSLYFAASGQTDSHQLYLRYLNARLKHVIPGTVIQVGRFGYTSGAESASGDAAIEGVKRLRLDSRLIGEFEWSLYQRAFDGVRVDVDRPRWHATVSAVRPTQGGFENAANAEMTHVDLFTGALTLKPGAALRHTEWQLFANQYDDTRAVAARPDNSGLTASSVDVQIQTFGTSVVGEYPAGPGRWDVVGWAAGQTGSWYAQTHRAWSAAGEAGYQWTALPWRPWIRAGIFRASGDDAPADTRHETYFPVMPTVRKYSLSTVYSLMNLNDAFAQAVLRPSPKLTLRMELHALDLVSAADRWYAGSGATQSTGTYFGYAGRVSNGQTRLGTMIEGSADRSIARHWSINGYVGVLRGGDVVRHAFSGDTLKFAYLENVIQF